MLDRRVEQRPHVVGLAHGGADGDRLTSGRPYRGDALFRSLSAPSASDQEEE